MSLQQFTPYPMPDHVIKAVDKWGKRDMERNARSLECRLEFWNRIRERFVWDNDDLEEEIKNDQEYVRTTAGHTIAHANLTAEHPGITLESEVVSSRAAPGQLLLLPPVHRGDRGVRGHASTEHYPSCAVGRSPAIIRNLFLSFLA